MAMATSPNIINRNYKGGQMKKVRNKEYLQMLAKEASRLAKENPFENDKNARKANTIADVKAIQKIRRVKRKKIMKKVESLVKEKESAVNQKKKEPEIHKAQNEINKTKHSEEHKALSEIRKTQPEVQNTQSELRKAQPEVHKAQLEAHKPQPEVHKVQPEARKTQPEVHNPPDILKTQNNIYKIRTEEKKQHLGTVNNTQNIPNIMSDISSSDRVKPVDELPAFVNPNYKSRYLQLMSKVNTAKRTNKTFCLLGDYPRAVREALVQKGWVERYCNEEEKGYFNRLLQKPPDLDCKIMSHILNNHPIKLIWTYNHVNWQCIGPGVIVNRIPYHCHYFSKIILAEALNGLLPFYYSKGEVNARMPRTYEVHNEGDLRHFSAQFRISACISLIRKFVDGMKSSTKGILTLTGNVPLDILDFALKRCVEFVQYMEHADLDDWYFCVVRDDEWALFLLRFYDIAHYDSKFKENNSSFDINKLNDSCKKMVSLLKKYYPDLEWEGYRNMWIVKPANMSCGRGVKIYKTLQEIQRHCKPGVKYVIQKYIEKPLLIFNTKFDVRQWFLISSVYPLTIWMYSKCYLRFCSQEFNLMNTHESIHLSNNSVQWKYKNGKRSSELPTDNMWDSDTFVNYLRKLGDEEKWRTIQSKMRQAITGACLVSQEHMGQRVNSFNLYGADFMLTPDYEVYLIEINSHPSMKYSTSVTSKMCRAVLEDTLKVVLDRRIDKAASTGNFFICYQQKVHDHIPSATVLNSLVVSSRKARIYHPQLWKNLQHIDTKIKKTAKKKPPPIIQLKQIRPEKLVSYEELATYKVLNKVTLNNVCTQRKSTPLEPGDASSTEELQFSSALSIVTVNKEADNQTTKAQNEQVSIDSDSNLLDIKKNTETYLHLVGVSPKKSSSVFS